MKLKTMSNRNVMPDLIIGDLHINPPIIQGGMGVLISGSHLASAVSNEGALGVIAAVGSGEVFPDTGTGYVNRSYQGLRQIIRETRKLTNKPIAVNIMCALANYETLVQAADEEKIDVIISGAGLPMHLPALIKNSVTKLIPIVSSGRAAAIICRNWQRKYHRLPDAFIIEGSSAGGHLGFSAAEITAGPMTLEEIVKAVLEATAEFKTVNGNAISVIAAGGIFTGADIAKFMQLGAAGVQMGTRFVCTHECDAAMNYKQAYLDCEKQDIIIIKSPVQMPLRVIRNTFVERMLSGERTPFKCTYHCLRTCDPEKSRYCIAQALLNASRGDLENGFVTCGANAHRIDRIVSVHELITELVLQYGQNVNCGDASSPE